MNFPTMSQINGPLLSASNSKLLSIFFLIINLKIESITVDKSPQTRRRSKQPQNNRLQKNETMRVRNSASTLQLYEVEPVSLFER